MIIKSFQISKLKEIETNFYLFYGENEGFKNQIINQLIFKTKKEVLRYEESEILSNPESFFSEVNNKSFFQDDKIIIISRSSEKILKILEEILNKNIENIKIIINSKNLEKKSKLRNLFEKGKKLVCIPFYEDDSSTLSKLAGHFFRERGIMISQENINIIVERCRGDRENLNNELSKIESFSINKKKISYNDILKLTNLADNYSYSELSDHCLNKNLNKTIKILNENNYNSEDCIAIIRTMLAKVKRLVKLKEENIQESNVDTIITKHKPPIFWKDKEIVKSQMKIWSLDRARQLMYILNEVELLIKKENENAVNILYDFILSNSKVNT